jgi:MOSC domain-containing protein YiiM
MGRLLGIARAGVKRAPLIPVDEAMVDVDHGITGDARGAKPGRQVTVLFREGWEAACGELGVALPWLMRRANLFVEGIEIPREGRRLLIGDLMLEVIQETQPCGLMEAAHRGLRAALKPEWRGGVCCNVLTGGVIRVSDEVRIE